MKNKFVLEQCFFLPSCENDFSNFFTIPNYIWFKFGQALGTITNPILLSLVYFIVLTPYSIFVRVFMKDILNIKYQKEIYSYWKERTSDPEDMKKQY